MKDIIIKHSKNSNWLTHIGTYLLAVLLYTLSGCTDSGLNDSGLKTTEPKAVINKEPVPAELVKETKKAKTYKVHYEFQEEQWDDPEILSTTRVQFSWVKPGDKKTDKSLWSMRLDGSDLRQVASVELLDTPTAGALDASFPIVRSPNNRYVAFAVRTCPNCSERRILDLETKEVIVAPMGGNNPGFKWMPDSKSIVFNAEGLMHYNLETRKGEYIRSRFRDDNWGSWHLIDNGKKIIVSLNKKSYTYDFNSGELLKEQEGFFGSNIHGHYLTYDQKYWIVLGQSDAFDGYGWSNFDSPDEPFEQAGRTLGGCYASFTYRAPIYKGFTNGVKVVMPKGKKRSLYLFDTEDSVEVGNLTLYNVQAEDLERSY
jgi:outer membrane lipoprotein-sorting protein